MKTEIKINGISLTVDFSFEGVYYPETRECPAEYPEIVIHSIYSDEDIKGLLNWRDIENIEKIING